MGIRNELKKVLLHHLTCCTNCCGCVRLDVDNGQRLHSRSQSGSSARPARGFSERLDNDGSLLRSDGFGRGFFTSSARHRTQTARFDDDHRFVNGHQSPSTAFPTSMARRPQFLQSQVRFNRSMFDVRVSVSFIFHSTTATLTRVVLLLLLHVDARTHTYTHSKSLDSIAIRTIFWLISFDLISIDFYDLVRLKWPANLFETCMPSMVECLLFVSDDAFLFEFGPAIRCDQSSGSCSCDALL